MPKPKAAQSYREAKQKQNEESPPQGTKPLKLPPLPNENIIDYSKRVQAEVVKLSGNPKMEEFELDALARPHIEAAFPKAPKTHSVPASPPVAYDNEINSIEEEDRQAYLLSRKEFDKIELIKLRHENLVLTLRLKYNLTNIDWSE